MESVRVDQWLWAVRLAKTRTAANEACRSGRVRRDGETLKPAQKVRAGDVLTVRRADHTQTVEVGRLLATRVGAAVAVECYVDLTPPEDRPAPRPSPTEAPSGTRDRGAGRPTKRERRETDRLRGRRR